MAHPGEAKVAKVAHVNIFTDIVISNMSPAGLRSITRSLLAAHPDITQTFEAITQNYVKEFDLPAMSAKGSQIRKLDDLTAAQRTARCILGCGLSWMSIPVLGSLAEQTLELKQRDKGLGEDVLQETQANLDGDLVQAITAVRKTLFTSTGSRAMSETEKASITSLYDQLIKCRILYGEVFPFARGLYATASFLGSEIPDGPASNLVPSPTVDACPPPVAKEVFELAGRKVPRIFSGLWQLSSPSWGSAPTSKIVEQLGRAVKGGFTAFDMADHYGDAEIVFVCAIRRYQISLQFEAHLSRVGSGIPLNTETPFSRRQSTAYFIQQSSPESRFGPTCLRGVFDSKQTALTSCNSTGNL